MATVSVTISDAQAKAIELLKNDSSATVSSIVKAHVQSFANSQVRQALQNAVQGGSGQVDENGNQVIAQISDEDATALFKQQFLSS